MVLTLNRLCNKSFQPLCALLTVSMFLTDGLVYLAAKPTSCWTNNEERGGRKNGVWERTQDAIYILFMQVLDLFFLLFLNLEYAEDWEFGEKLELWGFIYEESSRFPNLPPETETCHCSCFTDSMGSHSSKSGVTVLLVFCKELSIPPWQWCSFWRSFQDSGCTRLCFQGFMLVWNARSYHQASSPSELLC